MNLNADSLDLDKSGPSGIPAAGEKPSAIAVHLDAQKNNVSMVVGTDDCIEGKLKIGSGKMIIVRGTVRGEIHSEGTVVVCAGAQVYGRILAASLMTEGTIGGKSEEAILDVGVLHIGPGSRTFADCTYDTLCVDTPNGGVSGRMAPRCADEASHA